MAFLTTVNFNRDGIPTKTGAGAAAPSGGDQFTNTGNELLIVYNGTVLGTPLVLTVPTIMAPDGFKPPDRMITVPVDESVIVGPFPPEWFGPTPVLNYSFTTDVVIKVIRPIEMTKV